MNHGDESRSYAPGRVYGAFIILAAAVGMLLTILPDIIILHNSPAWMEAAVATCMFLLTVTHAIIAVILYLQRPWNLLQLSMFTFIISKTMMWGAFTLTSIRDHEPGPYTLLTLYLLLVITLATVQLDWAFYRYYVLTKEEEGGVAVKQMEDNAGRASFRKGR